MRCRKIMTLVAMAVGLAAAMAAETFRVATYNLENYIEAPLGTRPAKSPDARAKIREGILALHPDVLALQEMGATNMLFELQASLKAGGLDLPHWEHVSGWDTNIHVAILSRFPIVSRRSHTKDNYLLHGRRYQVSRGFAEVDIEVNPKYVFTLFSCHLKSRRLVPDGDEGEMREQEARLLREKIDARLASNPKTDIIVAGDFNDTKNTAAVRAVLGRPHSSTALLDTRPAERNGDNQPNPNPRFEPRNITWTHYFAKEDTYSRIDYILLSAGMAREWVTNDTYILTLPNWAVGSDHRPIVATFLAEDK